MDIEDLVLDGKYVAGRGCKKRNGGRRFTPTRKAVVCGRSMPSSCCAERAAASGSGDKTSQDVGSSQDEQFGWMRQQINACDGDETRQELHAVFDRMLASAKSENTDNLESAIEDLDVLKKRAQSGECEAALRSLFMLGVDVQMDIARRKHLRN